MSREASAATLSLQKKRGTEGFFFSPLNGKYAIDLVRTCFGSSVLSTHFERHSTYQNRKCWQCRQVEQLVGKNTDMENGSTKGSSVVFGSFGVTENLLSLDSRGIHKAL